MSYYKTPQYMTAAQLSRLTGLSPRQTREAIYLSLADGEQIGVIRPKSAKGYGHPRYKVSDLMRAWRYDHPLAVAD
jgi:hypothetical protein